MTIENLLKIPKQKLAEDTLEMYHEIQSLKSELSELKRLVFGSRSERFIADENPQQQNIFGEDVQAVATESDTISVDRKQSKKKKGHGRQELPAHLERIEHIIEPEADTSEMLRMGEEVTEELEYKPAELYVNKYIRPKYVSKDKETIIIGELPSRPIEKGIPGPGLLAHILTNKYVDHLPLYRQRQIFKRNTMDIAASSIDNWIVLTCNLIKPLYDHIGKRIGTKKYVQADESPVRVQDRSKKGKTHQGYFWVYNSPLDTDIYFDYRKTRSRAGPESVLADFSGWLQSDGYAVYDGIGKREDIETVHCMAHARRYFDKALKNDDRSSDMMKMIQKLYDIERNAREDLLDHEQRQQLRQKEALPITIKMKAWLDKHSLTLLPKSDLGKAVTYMNTRWKTLTLYLKHGLLEIDNNWVENAIRPIALGRKNWLFAGSHKGADRSAMIYTLVENAKQAGINPYAYLKTVIARIADHPMNKLDDLLPQNIQLD